jgi:tRNA (uracil-5-)-methyltransferase TRM9
MKKSKAEKIIKQMSDGYNLIADDFSESRYQVWPEMIAWQKYFTDGQKVLDVGCGNGRMTQLLADKKIEYVGCDISSKLINIAKAKCQQYNFKTVDFQVADIRQLPWSDDTFDVLLAVAVLHHLPHPDNRWRGLQEMYRVLKPGGMLLMNNWYFWNAYANKKYQIKKQILVNWLRGMEKQALLIPWKDYQGKVLLNRYYYAFHKRELGNLLEQTGFILQQNQVFSRQENVTKQAKFESLLTIAKKPV